MLGFALATALAAQCKLPVPGTPVPLTLQTLVVVLAGVSLGPTLGVTSMLLYLLLGSIGYHAFAVGGTGAEALSGPTAGYLVGFVLAQPILGRLTRPDRRSWPWLVAALLAGHAVIFVAGLAWLAISLRVDVAAALALGLWPFVPGTIVKTLVALPLGRAALTAVRPRLVRA